MSATGSTCSTRAARWRRAPRTRFAATSTSRTRTSAEAAGATRHRMPDAALSVERLDVSYDGVPAVRGVDLDVGPGEIVGLVGPNGAGKSSLLHAIMGVV